MSFELPDPVRDEDFAEPKPRRDGVCAREGCTKTVQRTKQARRYSGGQIDMEPFCSSRCCRRFHGCELDSERGMADEEIEARSERGRDSKVNYVIATGGRI